MRVFVRIFGPKNINAAKPTTTPTVHYQKPTTQQISEQQNDTVHQININRHNILAIKCCSRNSLRTAAFDGQTINSHRRTAKQLQRARWNYSNPATNKVFVFARNKTSSARAHTEVQRNWFWRAFVWVNAINAFDGSLHSTYLKRSIVPVCAARI